MKIRNLAISNFKAIEQIDLHDLKDVIVIAGPNGCGKSTIFDAIRFWKTTIGTYQKNEMQQWLSELGFSGRQDSLLDAHQNRNRLFSISATVELSAAERAFLEEHADALLAFYFFKQHTSSGVPMMPVLAMQNLDLIEDFRSRKVAILQQVSAAMDGFRAIPADNRLNGKVTVETNGSVHVTTSFALQVALSVFVPNKIGIIDYYGPQRTFGRESVNSLNLQVDEQHDANRANSALYNQGAKYSTVKSELASSYVKRLITESADGTAVPDNNLEASIQELFTLFIPGKVFEGIQPTIDGSLTFNVRTAVGTHDIGDLSSGEKELIYGYLRLKSSRLKNSVILIDEPELHLNPRLTDGLPDFYYRQIGKAADNQLWLVTHSDNILRQSVDIEGFNVFHMQTVGTYDNFTPQMVGVSAQSDLDRAIIDLVGDLAAYRPGGKLVILEGGGNPEFDLEFVSRLFPDFAQRVNLVSSGSKKRVRALHDVLERFGQTGRLFSGVWSIVDSDGAPDEPNPGANKYQWDRYHIENYLLEPRFILEVLTDHFILKPDTPEADVLTRLKEAARSTKDALLRHEIEQFAWSTLSREVKVVTARNSAFDPLDVGELVKSSLARMLDQSRSALTGEALKLKTAEISARLDSSLESDAWISDFRGRDVLKALVAQINHSSLGYDSLRNQILAKMRKAQFKPEGVRHILVRIEPSIITPG
jgi:hypothetical protein